MIVHAQLKDASLISDLVNSAYRGDSSRKGWTTEADLLDGTRTDPKAIAEIMTRPGTVLLKYIEGDEIIGCVELDRRGNQLYLGMLTVKPVLQGKGLGKELLQAAEDEARRQGCEAVFMTVITVRVELLEWYFRHGYKDTGERKPLGIPKKKLEFAVLRKPIAV